MHPSTALATALVDELVRGGVREAVLSPGSRNAPLSYALHEADEAGRLRLHVRVDERCAGFLALGLAKASGIPVPLVCTSGTAAANLHPAVLEAHHAGVALVVLTADRPAELQGIGANQSGDQHKLYGDAVRAFFALAAPECRDGQNATWRALVCRVLATAAGELDDDPGPVHVNVALRDPLAPDMDGDTGWPEPLDGREDGGPWTRVSIAAPPESGPYDGEAALGSGLARTLVIVGDAPPEIGLAAAKLAEARGWPLIAEPSAGAASGLPHGVLLLAADDWLQAHLPQRVLVVGRPTLSRPVQRLLADPRIVVEVVATTPRWPDPSRRARAVHHRSWLGAAGRRPATTAQDSWTMSSGPEPAATDLAWAQAWHQAAAAAHAAVETVLADSWPSGPRVARDVVAALPPKALLLLGSSSPVRDVDVAACWDAAARRSLDHLVLANRGLAGIDGTVSTAIGAALSVQRDPGGRAVDVPAYALIGDLTFLHDANGLLLGPSEPRPDLCLVVVNDDGGSIFASLEHGEPARAASFERIFGTPTGADLAALCAVSGTPHERVTTPQGLREALAPRPGLRVVEVPVDRARARALNSRLREAVARSVAITGI